MEDALRSGADLFVTADIGYHKIVLGASAGLSIAVCEHGEMESASLDRLSELIRSVSGLEVETARCREVPSFFDLEGKIALAKE